MSGVQRLSNESDIENNDDLFDKLFAKKPLRTYKGKSVSPENRKAKLFDGHRRTLGDTPLSSPRITKWIEEQAIIRLDKLEVDKDEVFEDTHVQEQLIDNKLIEKDVKVTPRGRRRARNNEIREKEEIRGKNEKSEVLIDEDESPKRTIRSRKRVVKTVEANIKTADRDERADIRRIEEKTSKMMPDQEIEFKPRKAGIRSRRKENKEQLEKLTPESMDKIIVFGQQEDKGINEVDSTIPDFNLQPAKSRTPKKKLHKGAEDQIAEVHSTTKDVSSPAPKYGMQETDEGGDEEIKYIKIKAAISNRRRGRTRNIPQEETVEAIEKIVLKRGRGKIESKEEVVESPRLMRSRRAEKKDKQNLDEAEGPTVIEQVPVRRGRRRNPESVDEDNKEKGSKQTKAASRDDDQAMPENGTIDTMKKAGHVEDITETTSVKRAVRNKKPAGNIDSEELVEVKKDKSKNTKKSSGALKVEEVVKKTRGRKAVQENEKGAETPEVKKGRSRRKMDTEGEEPKPYSIRKTRQRGAKNMDVEQEDEVENVESPEVVRKPVRSRKKVILEDVIQEEDIETKSTLRTRSRREPATKEDKASNDMEEVSAKATRKARGKALVEEVIDVDSPRATRSKRGNFKKYGSEFELSMEKKKPNMAKKVTFENTENAEENTEKKRKGRNAAASEEIEETSRKSKRTRK